MLNYIKGLPDKLTRVTSGGNLIREVDGLRFVAIFPVVIQHLHERFERNTSLIFSTHPEYEISSFIASRGFIGVYIFFVISGFILALPFASHQIHGTKEVNLKSYYWRRITRLEPPYIIAMTSFFLILLVLKKNDFYDLFPHFLASIFYLHSIIFETFTPINPPAWTLEIEIQFYLLAPFLAPVFFSIRNKIYRRVVLSVLIISTLLIQTYYEIRATDTAFLTILAHLQYFLIGFMLADLFLCEWKKKPKNYKGLDVIVLISIPALILSWSWEFNLINRVLFCVALFFFFYSSFRGYYFNKFLKNKWIMAIGGMCYTIYLLHLPLAELVILFSKSITFTNYYLVNFLIQLLIFLPILFFISVIFYLTIEKPCMDKNWPKTFTLWTKDIWKKNLFVRMFR